MTKGFLRGRCPHSSDLFTVWIVWYEATTQASEYLAMGEL